MGMINRDSATRDASGGGAGRASANRIRHWRSQNAILTRDLRNIIGSVAAVAIVAFAIIIASTGGDSGQRGVDRSAARGSAQPAVHVVAPGLVEPISEEIEIASDVIGRLKSVPVQEGDVITRGEILAEVENADLKAELAVAEANVEKQQAELDRLKNGARPEERQAAAAELDEAAARERQAQRDLARKAPLAETGVESRSKLDEAAATASATAARRAALAAQQALIDGAPRPEDVRVAEAELAQAQAKVAEIHAEIDKTILRSPIDGVVLSRQKKTGETVSNLPPTVIMHIGDISRLRVRADVDETDIAHLAVGQRVSVSADAFGDRRFGGTIVHLASSLGRKNFRTDRPTEKVDTKILETLIDLDPDVHLPVGLRVDMLDEGETNKQPQPQPEAVSALPAKQVAPAVESAPQQSPAPAMSLDVAVIQPVDAPNLSPQSIAASDAPVAFAGLDTDTGDQASAPAPEATAAAANQPSHASYGAPADEARIVLSATDDTWVQVKDDSGNAVFTRMLKAGDLYAVPDRKGLTLTAGNAGGLEITVDGTQLPPLGKPGHVVRDMRLDPTLLLQRVAGIK